MREIIVNGKVLMRAKSERKLWRAIIIITWRNKVENKRENHEWEIIAET